MLTELEKCLENQIHKEILNHPKLRFFVYFLPICENLDKDVLLIVRKHPQKFIEEKVFLKNIKISLIDQISYTFESIEESYIKFYKTNMSYDEVENLFENEFISYFKKENSEIYLKASGIIKMWYNFIVEILSNLVENYQILTNLYLKNVEQRLVNIRTTLGDAHYNFKSVSCLYFEDSKIIYKPRNSDIDIEFYNFLNYIKNKTGTGFSFFAPRYLAKKTYTFMEYIEEEKIMFNNSYFFNSGFLSGILFMFNINDLHFENIKFPKPSPCILDLETLFQPTILGEENLSKTDTENIYSTSLFPSTVRINGKHANFAKCGFYNLFKELKDIENEKSFLDGLNTFFIYLEKNKHQVVSRLESFKNLRTRVLIRNTETYFVIINYIKKCKHIELDGIKEYLSYANNSKLVGKIINSESEFIISLTVPKFEAIVDSNEILTDYETIDDVIIKTGYDIVKERILNFDVNSREKQVWLVKESIQHFKSIENRKNYNSQDYNDLRQITKNYKNHILKHSFIDKKGLILINSLKVNNLRSNEYRASCLKNDLFQGVAGELLFLFNYYFLYGDKDLEEKIKILFNHFLKYSTSQSYQSLGLYAGVGSIILILTEAYKIGFIGKENVQAEILKLLVANDVYKKISEATNFGLIYGLSGFLLSILHLKKMNLYFDDNIISLVIEKLSTSWISIYGNKAFPSDSNRLPLTGMAHGAAGMTYTLVELLKYNNYPQVKQFISNLLSFENSFYNEEHNNWKDNRDFVIDNNPELVYNSFGWSHGAPGIGLCRLKMIQEGLGDNVVEKDLINSINASSTHFNIHNDNLSTGNFGIIELLYQASKYDKKYLSVYERFYSNLIGKIKKTGFTYGKLPYKNYLPGFMTHTTGIVNQLLRFNTQNNEMSSLLTF